MSQLIAELFCVLQGLFGCLCGSNANVHNVHNV